MKFELEPYRRNISESSLLNDLVEVSKKLGKTCITEREYNANGKYSSGTFRRKFRSWNIALEKAGLTPENNWFNISDESYINDLKQVAHKLGKRTVTQTEYDDLGKYSSSAIRSKFGSWFKALAKAGLDRTRNLGITDEEYFQNLEKVWTTLGRQPTGPDMRNPLSTYSVDAYADRFGTWRKALEKFVGYVNREPGISLSDNSKENNEITPDSKPQNNQGFSKKSRNISWRLRFLVMRRDGFKCRNCGRSPATDPGIILHIDH
jgi:hypothetical protein